MEVRWMLGGAVEWGFTSIDGSKFAACNSKNNNFTKNKLDDRIKWLNGYIEEYLRILDEADGQEDFEDNPERLTRELIEEKLQEARERLKKYDGYQRIMEESVQSQMTLTDAEDMKKVLHAGVIPEAYTDAITDIEVKEVRRKVSEEAEEPAGSIYGTAEEMLRRAKEGYFVRDPERNLVYCPNGEILHQKSIKKNGNIQYANKNACRHCPEMRF